MKRLTHFLLSAVACYSLQDLRNEGCRVLCVRDGYSGGTATKAAKGCACVDTKDDYEDYIARRVKLGYITPSMIDGDKKTGVRVYTPSSPYRFNNNTEDDEE